MWEKVCSPSGGFLNFFGKLNAAKTEIVAPFETETKRGNIRVLRQDLREMLLSRLPPDTVQWGRQLTSFSEDEDGVTLRWHGRPLEETRVDVLVGADGIRSVVRRLLDAREEKAGRPVSPLRYLGLL